MFQFDFTLDKLAKCISKNKNPQLWYDAFCEYFPAFDIVTPARVAGFVAQCQLGELKLKVLPKCAS